MSRSLRIEFPGAWYHVMNRGASRTQKHFQATGTPETVPRPVNGNPFGLWMENPRLLPDEQPLSSSGNEIPYR